MLSSLGRVVLTPHVLQVCLWQHYSAKGTKRFSKLIKAAFYDKVTSCLSCCCCSHVLPCHISRHPCSFLSWRVSILPRRLAPTRRLSPSSLA